MFLKDFVVPDTIWRRFLSKSGSMDQAQASLEKHLILLLTETSQYDLDQQRIVILGPDHLKEFQKIADKVIKEPREIVDLLRELVSLRVQGVKVYFTPDQLRRFKQQAEVQEVPFGTYLTERIKNKLAELVVEY